MELVIRQDIKQYLEELEQWLEQTKDAPVEDMSGFFSARLGDYEQHMALWKEAYQKFARLLPPECEKVLDLGCGTGLELDEIYRLRPDVQVTGVDLCKDMLGQLRQKHPNKPLTLICQDYFQYDMGQEQWDAVISFESLHHFLPEKKGRLYQKIYTGLRRGGVFLLGDYIACCPQEERMLQEVYLEKRKRYHVPEEAFIHLDIPLTLECELDLLRQAGFGSPTAVDSIQGATFLVAQK